MIKHRELYDGEQEAQSLKAGKSFDPDENMTRAELLPETDLHELLRRYAPFELPAKEVFYGEVDLSLDRHEAVISLRDAVEAAEAASKAAEASSRSGEASGASPSASAAGASSDASGAAQ